MANEITEIKFTILYCILSTFITSLIIFLNKEEIWWIIIRTIKWENYDLMVTNFIEGVIIYIKMSLYTGFVVSILSWIILLLMFFIKGMYRKEVKELIKWLLLIISSNIIIFPFICANLSEYLLYNAQSFIFMGKFSELLNNIINIWWISQLVWVIPLAFNINWVRSKYIKNRSISILILYGIISLISPPDVIISTVLVGICIITLEVILFIKI